MYPKLPDKAKPVDISACSEVAPIKRAPMFPSKNIPFLYQLVFTTPTEAPGCRCAEIKEELKTVIAMSSSKLFIFIVLGGVNSYECKNNDILLITHHCELKLCLNPA